MFKTLASRIAFVWIVCLLNFLLFFLFPVMPIIFILHNLIPRHKCTSLWFFPFPLKYFCMELLFIIEMRLVLYSFRRVLFVNNLDFFFNIWTALPGVAIWISYTLLGLLDRLNSSSISSLNSGVSFTYSSSSMLYLFFHFLLIFSRVEVFPSKKV